MAKSTATKNDAAKSSAAFASKNDAANPSEKNLSKFSPTKEAEMDIQSLGTTDGLLKLFTDSIKDIYWAENQLVKALPKMAKSAGSPKLAAAILKHLGETKEQVRRLENVFELLGKGPQAKKCDSMEGLTKEGEAVIEDTDQDTAARDLGIIMASQKVEHYEISSYTGLIKLSNILGLQEISAILSETLKEEENSDATLSSIADTIALDEKE